MYDVVAENVAGTGIKVIATKNIELLAKKIIKKIKILVAF